MYPDFSYIMHHLFGTQPDNAFSIIKSFGLMMAMAFVAASILLRAELKRKEQQGLLHPVEEEVSNKKYTASTYLFNLLFSFILGYKVLYIFMNSEQVLRDFAGFLLSGQGSSLGGIIGLALGFGLTQYWASKEKIAEGKTKVWVYPHERVADITFLAALSGVAGAKLFAIFESSETLASFLRNPIDTLFSGSGLAIYGGLIVAFAVVYRFVKRKKIPPIHVMDAIAPGLMVGYGVGRIGCQISGDGDWGIPNPHSKPSFLSWIPDRLWAFDYPHNVLNEGVFIEGCEWNYCMRLEIPVYPTPIYETLLAFLIGGFLWSIRKKLPIAGMLFFIYVFFNGLERFFIEKIRVNDKIYLMGMELTQAEIISTLLMITGLVGMLYLSKRGKRFEDLILSNKQK
jgi:phosphatidylglycerol---prolipoprotein diacylglyceryl transferase